MQVSLTGDDALVVVDVQNDFCPGGALPAPDGDKVVPPLNDYVTRFHRAELPIAASRDWHPNDHRSFEAEGGPWPPHCLQGSEGAEYHPDLEFPDTVHHVKKGRDPDEEDYSAFKGGPDLGAFLEDHGVERVFVGGLTTEYCVKNTVEDALDRGFQVFLLRDAIKPVDPDDEDEAIAGMLEQGAVAVEADEFVL
jgi:nicotinamidase/pyrazinamidase